MHFFGSEVRHARSSAGMTQGELGRITGYDGSEVSRIEAGLREATVVFAEGCDRAFPSMNGWFTRFVAESQEWDGPYPPWFRDWVETERKATVIRWWEPLLIPGLCQTPDYMRAVFESWRRDDGNTVDSKVALRIERQQILERDTPPELWVLVDESVLRRSIGTADTMAAQLDYLAALAQRPNVTVQVVLESACAYAGLSGAFAVATVESDTVAYLETTVQGMTVREPALVNKSVSMFDQLRGEALPRNATLEIIAKVAEQWKL